MAASGCAAICRLVLGRGRLTAVEYVPFAELAPADYLQRVAASDAGRAYKSLALRELGIRRADTVVDLGCGPGTDLREFAAATGADGSVIGLDCDDEAIAVATEAVADYPWVQARKADVHSTQLPDGGAERVHADRVLQHVADPALVVYEARRLLRAGGRAVFAEPDYDTLVIDYPDVTVAQAYRSFVTERVVRNATIGRALPRLARRAGFASCRVVPVTSVFTEVQAADDVLGLKRVTDRAVAAHYLDSGAAARWLGHLAREPFLASVTLFLVIAET